MHRAPYRSGPRHAEVPPNAGSWSRYGRRPLLMLAPKRSRLYHATATGCSSGLVVAQSVERGGGM